MRVIIEINCYSAAFEDDPIPELRSILGTVPLKVVKQLSRPASLCDADESADKLMDVNGNTVGTVKVER